MYHYTYPPNWDVNPYSNALFRVIDINVGCTLKRRNVAIKSKQVVGPTSYEGSTPFQCELGESEY